MELTDRIFYNLDVKFVDIGPTARLSITPAGIQKVRAHVDPLLFGVAMRMKF